MSVFSHIWTECGNLRSKSPHSVQIRENTEQKKLPILTIFTQCHHLLVSHFSSWASARKIRVHCVKSARIRSFSGLYFPAFRLNAAHLSVFSQNIKYKNIKKRLLFYFSDHENHCKNFCHGKMKCHFGSRINTS